jgi:hypothetical protein
MANPTTGLLWPPRYLGGSSSGGGRLFTLAQATDVSTEFDDDFNRANNSSPGTNYTVTGGTTVTIASNKLHLAGTGVEGRARVTGAGNFSGGCYAQVTKVPNNAGSELGLIVYDGDVQYFLQLVGGKATLFRGTGFTQIAQVTFPLTVASAYEMSLWGKPGEQQAWVNNSLILSGTHSATITPSPAALRSTVTSTSADADGLLVSPRKTVLVYGMPSGTSARVKSGAGVIVGATTAAVSGLAAVDLGGVSMPAGSVEVIETSSGTVLATYTGTVRVGHCFNLWSDTF